MANVSPEVEPGAAAVPIDGRRARRERGRAAVVDALFELLQERHTLPGVEAIAERAGVSVSSVFRYFDGLDDLREHTIERYFERFAPLFEVPQLGAGPLRQRIARLVEARLDLYDAIAPMAHIARLRALEMPRFATTVAETRAGSAAQIRTHFAEELAGLTPDRADDLAAIVDSLTSIESWELQSETHQRSRQQIRRSWTDALTALLSA
ncbi:MAG: TetR/AcrR family transcriptional regulator [Candidatus Microthrix sp.]|jgi:AcrR family transcriptional regulator|nr:TetR/AcrR family transcriptional regulator [Candidatus Microthrix sp.]MBK6437450.1 TetR/AcrR family transcriptional regulator [Candidatus Microthrix sp.]MBK6969881.1 TetR/AcrR family transcriptional regulator [Candidatus Microthrix sp.]MBK7165909.1 TetR/AcrR family transcriptional regulator [Candidatus Microthrix sp.]MBK9560086.1 TetR/AcrR family transcriptional regulator [Candidatus Microthrix sp.]MBP7595006.1 TetR/AcrR family transcriptional regulator [Candidatus Microthrix sp.]